MNKTFAQTRQVPVQSQDLVHEYASRSFRLTEARHFDALEMHDHEHATLTLLLAGAFEERYGLHGTVDCRQGSVLLRPAGERHADRFGPQGALNLVVEFFGDDEENRWAPVFERVHAWQLTDMPLAGRRLQAELRSQDTARDLILEGLVLELAGMSVRANAARDSMRPWLKRVRDLLHDEFRSSTLRVQDIATQLGMHPVYLARQFRQHFGRSPGDYIRHLRIEWAATQLTTTDLPIATIAADAGFFDQSHFARVFRQQKGCSPVEWRNMTTN